MRSKGKWTITVGYGPEEKCAIVSLFVDMGPLDFDREYERVFMNGGGAISDSGTFIHKIDDVESALRIHNSTCRVPAPESQKSDAESKERQALEEERERLALEEEREHLALEEERERLALEEERERLALEEERERLAEEHRLAEERESQRLARAAERTRTPKTRASSEENASAKGWRRNGESGQGESQSYRESKRGESRNNKGNKNKRSCALKGEAGPMQRPSWVS